MNRFASYVEYLQSDTWKEMRDVCLARANYKCQVCSSAGELHVHHREYPMQLGTEPLSDLVVLCKKCHSLFHGINVEKNDAPACAKCGSAFKLYAVPSETDAKDILFCRECHLEWIEFKEQEWLNRV